MVNILPPSSSSTPLPGHRIRRRCPLIPPPESHRIRHGRRASTPVLRSEMMNGPFDDLVYFCFAPELLVRSETRPRQLSGSHSFNHCASRFSRMVAVTKPTALGEAFNICKGRIDGLCIEPKTQFSDSGSVDQARAGGQPNQLRPGRGVPAFGVTGPHRACGQMILLRQGVHQRRLAHA